MDELLDGVVVHFAEVVEVCDAEETRVEGVESVDLGRFSRGVQEESARGVGCDDARVELSLFVELGELLVSGVSESLDLVEVSVDFRQQFSAVRLDYSVSNWLAWSNLPSRR